MNTFPNRMASFSNTFRDMRERYDKNFKKNNENTEETVSGYRDARYSNPSGSSTEGEPAWIPSTEYALNNGKIINKPENSVELPHTGGPGTRALTILGVMLIALAGAGLVLRKRRREAAQGIKHL